MVDILRGHQQIRCQPFQLSDKPENVFRIIRVLCEKFDSRWHPVGVIGLVQPEKQLVYLVCMMRSSELAIFQLNVGIRIGYKIVIDQLFRGYRL